MKKFLILDHYVAHPTFAYPDGHTAESFRLERKNYTESMQRFFDEKILYEHIKVEYQGAKNWEKIFSHLDSYSGIILGGSPFSVNDEEKWQKAEEKFLQKIITKKNIPILGICFGHQLLARLLGGKISSHFEYIHKDSHMVFMDTKEKIFSFACHGEYVSEIPRGAKILAQGEENLPYMVDYYPSKKNSIIGIQSHIEQKVSDEYSELFLGKIFRKIFL